MQINRLLATASRSAIVIGVVLGVLHLAWSWLIIVDLYQSRLDAQWELAWVFPFLVDFPVSLLSLLFWIVVPQIDVSFLPYPASRLNAFLVPAFVHGVLGPLYWFLIPILISVWRRRRASARAG